MNGQSHLTADDAARILVAARTPPAALADDRRLAHTLLEALIRCGIRAGLAPTDFGAIRAAFDRRMAVATTFH